MCPFEEETPPGDPLARPGAIVAVAARPDWGVGTVRSVSRLHTAGGPVQRIVIEFAHGRRTLQSPPARLMPPAPEPTRTHGWLEGLGKGTLDHRLRGIPEETAQVLGSPLAKVTALLPLYAHEDSPHALLKWARAQTGVADPLAHWNRDELLVAFEAYCTERDSLLRAAAALLVRSEGSEALSRVLNQLEEPVSSRVRAGLQRIL